MNFLIFLSVIIYTLQYFLPVSSDYEDCENYMIDADYCWRDNFAQPKCTEEDPFLKCIGDILELTVDCPEDFAAELKLTKDTYQDMHDEICKDEELHKLFAANVSCWLVARSCVFKTAKTIYLPPEEITPELCSEVSNDFDACRDPWCYDLQVKYVDLFRVKSPCLRIELNVSGKMEISSVIMMSLTTILASFFM